MCIEYDGEQHFRPVSIWGGEKALQETKKRDSIKTLFCQRNKINLIRIMFKDDLKRKLIKNLKKIRAIT